MTPTEKLKLMAELSHQETERQKAGIRARHGDISDDELRMRVCMLRHGREITIKIFGWAPDD